MRIRSPAARRHAVWPGGMEPWQRCVRLRMWRAPAFDRCLRLVRETRPHARQEVVPLQFPDLWRADRDQKSPLRRCFKSRSPLRARCAGFASGYRSDWRLSGLLSGLPPIGTRPQARANVGRAAMYGFPPSYASGFCGKYRIRPKYPRAQDRGGSGGAEGGRFLRSSSRPRRSRRAGIVRQLSCVPGSVFDRPG